MNKEVKLPSIYGPVKVTIVLCDGPQCSNCNQPEHMIGWFRLAPSGAPANTLGGTPDPMDFCSLGCIKAALDEMVV